MSTLEKSENGLEHPIPRALSVDRPRIEVDKINLGPKWSEEEIEIFLKRSTIITEDYRANHPDHIGEAHRELNNKGFGRTMQNIYSLYLKNKNYLSFKSDCSAKDLTAIMADHYESETYDKEKANTGASLGKRDFGSLATRLDSRFDKGWKRHGGPVLRPTGIAPRIDRDDHQDLNGFKRLKIETKPQSRPKNSRKGKAPKSKALLNIQFDNDLQLFQKLEYLTAKVGNAKRRFQPNGTSDNVQSYDSDQLYKPFLRWVIDEYFYSDIDRGYFNFNLMHAILGRIELNPEEKGMTINEWNAVRRSIGKPRRFSQALVNQELELLNTFRERARTWLTKKQLINDGLFPKELTQAIQNLTPLQVGQNVLAVHPVSNLLHRGKILTIDENNIMVNFLTPDLGVGKVPDFNLLVIGDRDQTYDNMAMSKNDMFDIEAEQTNQIVRDLDPFAMAFLIKILEQKTFLVNELRHFNDLAEKKQANNLNKEFYEDMGWTGNHINSIDEILRHITTKFRMRGFAPQNPDKLGKNFENVFNIFRRNIEREIDLSRDPEQKEDLTEVRNFLNQTQDERIVKEVVRDLKDILPKGKVQSLEESIEFGAPPDHPKGSNMDSEEPVGISMTQFENGDNTLDGRLNGTIIEPELLPMILKDQGRALKVHRGMTAAEDMKLLQLILDCGGILKTIVSTHDINLRSNVFLRDFFNLTFDYKKECHDISNALVSLSSKIKSIH